jgi:hypothetical protein
MPMRQPPTGDKNKYEDQQRSNEGRAAVAAVASLGTRASGVWLTFGACLTDGRVRVSYGGAGSLCRVSQPVKLLDRWNGYTEPRFCLSFSTCVSYGVKENKIFLLL